MPVGMMIMLEQLDAVTAMPRLCTLQSFIGGGAIRDCEVKPPAEGLEAHTCIPMKLKSETSHGVKSVKSSVELQI